MYSKQSIKKMYCMNCGSNTHELKYCIQPIKSYGIIVFNYNCEKEDYEYLFICRKDSLGYVEFIRGKYNEKNEDQVKRLINEMTIDEKDRLLKYDFEYLWDTLWNKSKLKLNTKFSKEKKISSVKFEYLKHTTILERYIRLQETHWKYKEWGFPKGRRNYNETNIQTAIRECIEETGLKKDNINIIENVRKFKEIFSGSNYKSYETNYYLAKYENNIHNYREHNVLDMKQNHSNEVSEIKWFTIQELKNILRDYNYEKINILKQVEYLLKNTQHIQSKI